MARRGATRPKRMSKEMAPPPTLALNSQPLPWCVPSQRHPSPDGDDGMKLLRLPDRMVRHPPSHGPIALEANSRGRELYGGCSAVAALLAASTALPSAAALAVRGCELLTSRWKCASRSATSCTWGGCGCRVEQSHRWREGLGGFR